MWPFRKVEETDWETSPFFYGLCLVSMGLGLGFS
jgi:hypothetical protein